MVCRSYGQIDEHYGVARFPVGRPGAICGQLLERGGNLVWISSDIEPHGLKDSYNHIAHVSSHHITARIRDSLAPLTHIFGSKPFPVCLKNTHTSFALVDFFAVPEFQRYLHRVS